MPTCACWGSRPFVRRSWRTCSAALVARALAACKLSSWTEMLNCTTAVSGSASNFPSAPTQTVLGVGIEVPSWARNECEVRTTNTDARRETVINCDWIRFMVPFRRDRTEIVNLEHCKSGGGDAGVQVATRLADRTQFGGEGTSYKTPGVVSFREFSRNQARYRLFAYSERARSWRMNSSRRVAGDSRTGDFAQGLANAQMVCSTYCSGRRWYWRLSPDRQGKRDPATLAGNVRRGSRALG